MKSNNGKTLLKITKYIFLHLFVNIAKRELYTDMACVYSLHGQ